MRFLDLFAGVGGIRLGMEQAGLSNSQLYKQAGNSVTVPVIKAIADKMELLNN